MDTAQHGRNSNSKSQEWKMKSKGFNFVRQSETVVWPCLGSVAHNWHFRGVIISKGSNYAMPQVGKATGLVDRGLRGI